MDFNNIFLTYLLAAYATIDVNWSRVYEGLERGKNSFWHLPILTLPLAHLIFMKECSRV